MASRRTLGKALRQRSAAMTEDYAEYRDELLRDLRRVIRRLPGERFRAADLLPRLHALPGAPWGRWLPGRPLTAKALSMLLLPLGVQTVKVRQGRHSFMFYAKRDLLRVRAKHKTAADETFWLSGRGIHRQRAGAASVSEPEGGPPPDAIDATPETR